MITCPACGKENEDSAFECRRCRAPLREDVPEEQFAEPEAAPAEPAQEAAPAEPSASSDLGEVCRRCETYNEPGVRVCTNCGLELFADAEAAPPAEEPAMDKTPPQAWEPQHEEAGAQQGSLDDELSALALSDEEAAEAGLSTHGNGAEVAPPMDKTPPQAFTPPEPEEPTAPPPARGKVAEVAAAAATAAGVVVGAAVGVASGRRAPPAEPPPAPPAPKAAPEPAAAPAEKLCSSCGAANPPAAKFCFDCGTPFAKKTEPPKVEAKPEPVRAPPPPPPPSIHVEPSIQIAEELSDATSESSPIAEDQLPEELAAESLPPEEPLPEEAPAEEAPAEEAFAAEPLPEELPAEEPIATPEPVAEEEAPPPFQASLVVDKGASQGTAFMLAHLENSIGGTGAHIELGEDPFIAPHAATLLFAEDHLIVRDEGSANGVFVKVREQAPLEAGDHFVAGERLFRYDGPVEIAKDGEGDTPFLGAPRPQGAIVRVSEVLAGGKTGRTCHRAGPAIAIGRTGCDMNFPADTVLAAKHAEIRIGEDGSATLVDLGAAPSGVFLRVRAQGQQDLQAGDVVMVGEQLLRVELG